MSKAEGGANLDGAPVRLTSASPTAREETVESSKLFLPATSFSLPSLDVDMPDDYKIPPAAAQAQCSP